MDFETVRTNLIKNGFKVFCLEKKEDVVPLVGAILPKGAKTASGGSVSLDECGVTDFLKNGDYNYCYRGSLPDIEDVFKAEKQSDYFFASANAITKNGELYNVDGRSNRVSAIAHGAKNVIIIAGKNKIVEDLNEAVLRVKLVVAPKNARRLNYKTYCLEKGICSSISGCLKDGKIDEQYKKTASSLMTAGCNSNERICCNYLISAKQRLKDRITVILVNEDLGY